MTLISKSLLYFDMKKLSLNVSNIFNYSQFKGHVRSFQRSCFNGIKDIIHKL